MLAAIGIILIFKQLPHAFGYDKDFEGDESFEQLDQHNTFSELLELGNHFTIGAIVIALITFMVLYFGEHKKIKELSLLKIVPISLIAVLTGTIANILFESFYQSLIQGVTNNILKIELDFRLTEFDIQDFDFSIPIYLENPSGFYYVQEIKDFTSSKESTSVELLRIG
jgi:MFS superfamily sulfate permease-like transporter